MKIKELPLWNVRFKTLGHATSLNVLATDAQDAIKIAIAVGQQELDRDFSERDVLAASRDHDDLKDLDNVFVAISEGIEDSLPPLSHTAFVVSPTVISKEKLDELINDVVSVIVEAGRDPMHLGRLTLLEALQDIIDILRRFIVSQ